MTDLALALQEERAAGRWLAIAKLNEPAAAQDPLDAETLAALVEALADEHPFVRWQAGLALARRGHGRQKLIDVLKDGGKARFTATDETKAGLLQSAAIDALTPQQLPEIHHVLIDALQQGDPLVRQSAAEALAHQGAAAAIPHLIAAAQKDSDPWVRRAAVYALGHLKHAEASTAIAGCLTDPAVVVRRSAAYALGALRAVETWTYLRVSLRDGDPQVRRNAAWALGRIGRPEVVPDLKRLLDDTTLDGTVAATAERAIQAISQPRWLQVLLGTSTRFHRRD